MTPTETPALLRARGLVKRYGGLAAVGGVDLTVRAGTIHAVIGPNGAGKTTLFHTLTGTVPLTEGSIVLHDEEISRLGAPQRVRRGLSRSFQVTSLFQKLDVRENLRLAAQGARPGQAFNAWRRPAAGDAAARTADELLQRFGLGTVASRAAGALSHGQQRRLEIAMAMAPQPRLVCLDEPTSGMGVDDLAETRQLIHGLKRDGIAVLLIEHNMDIVMGIADTITVMQGGRVLVEGGPQAIRDDERVRTAYLGNMITGGRA